MKITAVISGLRAGGAERVLSTLVNGWSCRGHDVAVVTLESVSTDFYRLDKSVHRESLELLCPSNNVYEALRNNAKRVGALRRVFKDIVPNVVVSFNEQNNVLALLATVGLRMPVIVSERIDPTVHPVPVAWRTLRRWLYPSAAAVVVQTEVAARSARGVIRNRLIKVIPNPVAVGCAGRDPAMLEQRKPFSVVAMGRLVRQKGFDLLLEAFARSARGTDWTLTILGEGEERRALEMQAVKLGIEDRVRFPGVVRDPLTVLSSADIFALSSRYEGFPNALLEAMACGLPVISFDCPSGPRDIVRDNIDGLLVPTENVVELANALDRLIADPPLRQRLAVRAREVRERFNLDAVLSEWERLFQEVIGKPRRLGTVHW